MEAKIIKLRAKQTTVQTRETDNRLVLAVVMTVLQPVAYSSISK